MSHVSQIPVNSITSLNGKRLYYIFLAGANKILEQQAEINKINVFPVPDADTGTNLASTIRSVIDTIKPEKSYKNTADAIALAALSGARGNSGVIFAQFLHGLSSETCDCQEITVPHFAESIRKAIAYIYEAISHPVEGTMLTVMRDWADFIHKHQEKLTDFTSMLTESYEAARVSLAETKEKLKVLAKANVVDAGAKGFVVFLEGVMEFMHSRNIKSLLASRKEVEIPHLEAHPEDEEIRFRYCTEAMISNLAVPKEEVRKAVESFGDSVVMAGSDKLLRIHVHTDTPSALFNALRPFGVLGFQKADDMRMQYEVAYHRKYPIALVTDSTSDIPAEWLDHYQIHQLPVHIRFGDNDYLDRLTLQPEDFYRLTDTSEAMPSTSQVNEKAFVNLYSYLASHYEAILSVHISGHFSGTCKNALSAAGKVSREFGKPIRVIDSKNISAGLGMQVMAIARAIEEGKSLDEILPLAESNRGRMHVFVTVKSIRNLVRSGRVSPLKGMIARLLNIKPVITVNPEGKTTQSGKAMSQHAALQRVVQEVKKIQRKNKVREYTIMHAGNPDLSSWLALKMEILTGLKPLSVVQVSPALALHAGTGTVALALMEENGN